MTQEQTPTPPPANNQRTALYALLGVLVCGILLVGIAALLALRGIANLPPPTPTLAPDRPGVTPIDPGQALVDFTLPSSRGTPFGLSHMRGAYNLVFFGYLHCPDFCPLTLAEFRAVKRLLGDDAARVNFVFISVDGARDTPQALATYLGRFDPDFIGLQGDEVTLARIGADYGLYYELRTAEADANGAYPVDHSTSAYLIDPDGLLRRVYAYGTQPEVLADDLRRVMAGA